MPDRTVKILENGKSVARGVRHDKAAKFLAFQDKDETLTYEFDFAEWLGEPSVGGCILLEDGNALLAEETTDRAISSATISSSGATIVQNSTTATAVNFTASSIQNDGYATIQIVTGAGQKKDITLTFREYEA